MISLPRDYDPTSWESLLEDEATQRNTWRAHGPMPVCKSASANRAKRRAKATAPRSGLQLYKHRRSSTRYACQLSD